MRHYYFTISFLLLAARFWGQVDTRISPAPPPVEQMPAPSSSKWTGAPLTGFLNEALGSSLKEGLESTLAVSESATNQYPNAGATDFGFDEVSRVTGTLSLHRDWSRSSLLMQYVGGTDVYVKNSYLNDQFHQFSATEAMKLPRWNLSLSQAFNYLPQSSFGFDPSHAVGNGIAPASEISPGPDLFLPANVIERSMSTGLNAEYVLGARSGVVFSGNFNDLHFTGTVPGTFLVDSQSFGAGAQYAYVLNASNTIGAGYDFSQGRALGFASLIQTHAVTATYKRRIGSRLTLQAAAGPQFATFNVNGMETTLGASTNVTAGADYELERTSFVVSYFRGVNPGSGLFLGSRTDDIRGFVEHRFGRNLKASIAVGRGQNGNLDLPAVNTPQNITSTYLTATIERNFGPALSAFVTYNVQNQDVNTALCAAASCGLLPLTHSGMIGMRFHIHPLTLHP